MQFTTRHRKLLVAGGFFFFWPIFQFLLAITAAVLVIDAVTCDVEIVFNCDDSGKGSSKDKNGTKKGDELKVPSVVTPAPTSGPGSSPPPTFSPPPLPRPSFDPKTGFYADPERVQSDETTTLRWNVTDATACGLSGGGLSLPGLSPISSRESNPITVKTEFTLVCENGSGGPTNSSKVEVNLVPIYEEV